MFRRIAFLAMTILPALPALADPATPEGAARIAEALGRYLPQASTVLSVTPDGDTYKLRVSLDGYLALLPESAGNASISPYEAVLTDLGGGRWQMDYDQAFRMSADVPKALTLDVKVDSLKGRSIFDETLGAFVETRAEVSGLTLDETVVDPSGTNSQIAYKLDRMTYTATGTKGANGGIDTNGQLDGAGLKEDLKMAEVPMTISLAADTYVATFTGTGVQVPELMALAAWFVAHPSEKTILDDEQGLKDQLRATLPVFGNLKMDGTLGGVRVDTDLGQFGATTLGFGISMNGLVKEGRGVERISFTGLTLPKGLVPAWAEPLLPGEGSIGIGASGFDAAAMAQVALDGMNLSSGPAKDLGQRIGAAALPDGKLTVLLEDGGLIGQKYALTWVGTMDVGPRAAPVGKGTITLTGIDAIRDVLTAAPPEVSQGAIPGLMMAQGMGKADGDKIVWDIEATADGKLLVNGNDLSPMLGR